MDGPTKAEAERTRGEVARVRRSLLIIFGIGGVCATLAIVYVMRHLPEGADRDLGAAPLPGVSPNQPVRSRVCKRFGDPCEFRPGQLGACVQRENCIGNDCLFCQSQH